MSRAIEKVGLAKKRGRIEWLLRGLGDREAARADGVAVWVQTEGNDSTTS